MTSRAARRHSRTVRQMRLIVPASGVALLATYVMSATPPRIDYQFAQEFSQRDIDGATLRLDQPRYVGEDKAGRNFAVAAAAAERDPNAPALIDLEMPEALRSVATSDGEVPVGVRADVGQLNTDQNTIDLSENVELRHAAGADAMVLRTDEAKVDLRTNVVTATSRITGESAQGTVAADAGTAYQNEGRVVLEGNVNIRLNPKKKPAD